MAKKQNNPQQQLQDADLKHYRDTERYVKQVQQLYDEAIDELSELALRINDIPTSKAFSFKHNPAVAKDVETTIQKLAEKISAVVETGSRKEWSAACIKSDQFLSSIMQVSKIAKATLQSYQDRNLAALAAFTQREVDGMNLSGRVWKMVSPLQDEVEAVVDTTPQYQSHGINSAKAAMTMEQAVGTGMSAQRLSREVRECLQEPNKLFRRVRDKYGNLHLSAAAKLYHPGQGVYRSSYKNAMRLTRSEINMAYRQSDHMRWQQLDFVTGIRIQLSNNHTCLGADGRPHAFTDICDILAGDYPKDFKHVGWHPQCRCFATPILRPYDEMMEEREHIDEAGYRKMPASNEVKDPPKAFNEYITDNAERIAGWKSTPYYIKDNAHYVDKALHPEKYITKALTLTDDQQKMLDDFRMYAFNHQDSKKFAAALDDALRAQLAGDLPAFQAAVKTMADTRKTNERIAAYLAKKKAEAKVNPKEQRKAFDARIAAIREKAQLYPNSRISLEDIDTAYISMNLTKLEAAVAAQEDIIRRHEVILDLQKARRLRRSQQDIDEMLKKREDEKKLYEIWRKDAEAVAKKWAAHPWGDQATLDSLKADRWNAHLGDLMRYTMSLKQRLSDFDKKMKQWEAIVPDIKTIASQYSYNDFELAIPVIKKRLATIKRQKLLTNQEASLNGEVLNAANGIYRSAYEARLKEVRIDIKIEQLRPDVDMWVQTAKNSGLTIYESMADEARTYLLSRNVAEVENTIKSLKELKTRVDEYTTLSAFATTDKQYLGLLNQIKTAIENNDLGIADYLIGEAKKGKADLEKKAAAAAKKAAKKTTKKAAPAKKTLDKAENIDEIEQILGSDTPLMLKNYRKSVQRTDRTDQEYLDHDKQIEKKMKEFFESSDFAHQCHSELLGDTISYGRKSQAGGYLTDGILNNLQVNRVQGKLRGNPNYSYKGHGYDEGRRGYGHFAYNLPGVPKNYSYGDHVPQSQWIDENAYYRCGTPVPKDMEKAWAEATKVRGYGDAQITLRKDRVVATWTYGNSLGEDTIPSLACDPRVCSIDRKYFDAWKRGKLTHDNICPGDYIEMQYLPMASTGRILPRDIERIIVDGNPENLHPKAIWEKWKKAGVSIYYADSRGKIKLYMKGDPLKTAAEAQQHAQDIIARKAALMSKDIDPDDFLKIEDLLKKGDFFAADDLAQRIEDAAEEIAKRRAALTKYIPDVEQQNQRFTITELEDAYAAIEKQLAWYDRKYGESEDLIGKIARDVDRLTQAKAHSTWEIAANAYMRRRDELVYKFRKTSIDDGIKTLSAYKTKDKPFLELVAKIKAKAAEGRWGDTEELIKKAKQQMLQLQSGGKVVLKLGECAEIVFTSEDFEQARKDAAKWFRGKSTNPTKAQMQKAFKEADKYMQQYATEMWAQLSQEEKMVLWLYTDGSKYINEEMLGLYQLKMKDPTGRIHNGLEDANILTSIIQKAPALKDDMWMQSGKSTSAFEAMFGIDLNRTKDLSKIVGKEGDSKIFMSCHTARDGAFTKDTNTGSRNDVVLSIYMPKGTKGAYMEPFASFGDAKRGEEGLKWKGGKITEAPSDQVEFLLQRGARFKITKAVRDPNDGKWYIDVDLIGQSSQQALDTYISGFDRRMVRQRN